MLLWTMQVQFDKSAEKFSQTLFAVSTRKNDMCVFLSFSNEKNVLLNTSTEVLTSSLNFFCHKAKQFQSELQMGKKQIFKKTSFPQFVIVDKTNTLLTSPPELFCKLFLLKLQENFLYVLFQVLLTRKLIFWTRKTKF